MRTKTTFALIIIAAMALCLSVSQPAIASDEEDVLQVMTNWYKAFNTSDYELMASLHWDSSNLTKFGPWKAEPFLTEGWESIGADWKSGLDVPPGTYVNTMHHPQVTMLGNNVAIITCYNVQTYTDPTTKEQTVGQARGTFVVQKIGGKWLIVHEHSSLLPTE